MLAVIETSDYIIAEAFLTLHLARDFTVHRFFSTHSWHHFLALKFNLECKTLKNGMDYWLRGHEGEKNNCFSKIQLVGQKYPEWKKKLARLKLDFNPFLPPKSARFSLPVGYNTDNLVVAQPIKTQHW